MADNRRDLIGSWSAAGDWSKSVTLLEGLKAAMPEVNFIYARGSEIQSEDKSGFREAVNAARKADMVILALGEAYWMTGEAASRSIIDLPLPGVQEELAKEIKKTGKPIAAVLMNGRPLKLNWLDENISAILETWYLGTTAGNAIADVLTGKYNPSGKLPVTFPRNEGQIPIHYDMRNTGRPFDADNKFTSKYLDVPNTPLYPFGYGLSYTNFDYGPVSLSSKSMSQSDTLTLSVTVTNTGDFDGEEVVQLYLQDKVASVARPVKELRGFRKIHLEKGEQKKVEFHITNRDLSFYRADMSLGSEPGMFTVFVGGNSVETQTAEFELTD